MILKYMKAKDWAVAAICAVFILIQVYLDLRIPEYMSDITRAIGDSSESSVIYGYGGEMILCALASVVASLLASGFAAWCATSLCFTLRERIFKQVSMFTSEDISRFSIDSLITRCSNDVTQVQNFIAQALQVMVKTPILSVWALVKISGAEWEWTAATAIGVVLLIIALTLIIWATRPNYRLTPIITDKINHYSLEHLTGLRVVRAYNAESFQEEKFKDASVEMMDNCIYIWRRASLLPMISSATSNFLTLAIYWTGIVLISASTGSPHNLDLYSDMIVFSSYAIQVIAAFMSLSFLIQFSARAFASSRRVQEVIEYGLSIKDGDFSGPYAADGVVEFDHISFTYPKMKKEALHDISFKLEKGQTMAILGATGSGKSTLINLLLRSIVPDNGKISVDGVELGDYSEYALNSKIAFVPQTNMIFAGTIESNVNYGETASVRSIEDVRWALEVAQAKEFVESYPEKEQYQVMEGGKNLSGGQKQRISIARAICKNAEICVMDDPFSALDFATDKKLREALKIQCRDTTVILVTQRVGTAMDADMILVLDEGHIIGKGKHDDLMKSCDLYRELAYSQMVEGTE